MIETYQLLSNYLLVQIKEEEPKKGSLIMPDTFKKTQPRAIVIAVGCGIEDKEGKLIPLRFKVGDEILLPSLPSAKLHINGEDLFLITASQVIAIMGK